MKGWLLDTNIVSELRKPNCHPAVKQWSDSQPPQSFYLSTVTLAEIRFGIERVNNIEFRQELTQWLDTTLRPWFSDRILAVDEDTILLWRQMVEQGRKQGYTYSQPDLFIAAIASLHDLCVVTRNVVDFQKSSICSFQSIYSILTPRQGNGFDFVHRSGCRSRILAQQLRDVGN